ncbi:uncharacterized protein EKO05_0002561 [Ascochyta rabiei]|uniref:Uncharacterized protein n=1 Tax=Didymella rabiei TaxID=5454 RepID=A0A163II31_DIDRA|nr:uncharacterized protein EKO05_0002561 [Ascochyta rabiei]KZM25774.1 hypothetical protein ST47_g3071 [Ascochyta rabiei]UPX11983.1 hypothetical protein EKO05_0002561 [Ascochyta rabiei]
MSATVEDFQLAAVAAGFTIGFGFLTVWEAIQQTRRNRNPLRSVYIYMLWGEIAVNICIGVVGWLFLTGTLGPTVPVLFFILLFWVFQIQLLMQIIINRIALIAEHRTTVRNIKWGTIIVISAINIAVFCIWIPAHTVPPVSQVFVNINSVWDKISKVLILIVDAGLNWYFLRIVKIRLVEQVGLTKYKPLVSFNAKLMVVSIAMDGLLIGLMFLKNPIVYIQFHPVVYMVKLNIEMSMASLIVRLAQGQSDNDASPAGFDSSTGPSNSQSDRRSKAKPTQFQSFQLTSAKGGRSKIHSRNDSDESLGQIHRTTELNVVVEHVDKLKESSEGSSRSSHENPQSMFGDETPLHKNNIRITGKAL